MAAIELASTPLFSDANLVAYYKLENVNDSKASYNLTNNNTVAFNAAKFNNGADLGASNTNKYLSIANNLGITTGAFTISIWVKLKTEVSDGGTYCFIGQSSNTAGNPIGLEFKYKRTGSNYSFQPVRYRFGPLFGQDITYNCGALGTTNFNHIVWTNDGTNGYIYLNGNLVAQAAQSGSGSSDSTSNQFKIGSSWTGSTDNISSALIDDVAIFSRALTATEILNLYNGPSPSGFFNFF